jgi:Na+/H+-dicarboxylate symporter
MLWVMLPAYATALGTSSSAATIPVTLNQAKKMGIHPDIADFCIPLCATIHLSGSMLKITATALAVCMLTGLPHNLLLFTGFILILSVMMVAAPGVPGGAIMASIGILQTVLGFSETQNSIMIAVYLAIDSIGTAGNVTGDGAIAAVIDRFSQRGI